MSAAEHIILVVNRLQAEAEKLKELIEFMDTPHVFACSPEEWRQVLGEQRLEAVFVGPDLSAEEVDALIVDIGDFDANVPIVMLQTGEAA